MRELIEVFILLCCAKYSYSGVSGVCVCALFIQWLDETKAC